MPHFRFGLRRGHVMSARGQKRAFPLLSYFTMTQVGPNKG